jgi:ssRNA-specific RNase YbeY (16S rRNA maturation enzyme)
MPPAKVLRAAKDEVLGPDYDLSWAFVTDDVSDHNVLSYPLSPTAGEILINKKRAAETGFSVLKLFIHGLFHLKGYAHGSKMERAEQKILDGQKYRRWVGHRNRRHSSRRR